MEIATATLIVNGIIALMGALPALVTAIQNMDAPEEDKQILIDRIRAAQDGLPEWI